MRVKTKRKKINPKELRQSYLDRVENELEKDGVVFFDEKNLDIDGELLSLPRDITELSSKLLGSYLNAFTQQKMYLRTLLGRLELLAEEARRKYINACDPQYRQLSNSKMSETSKDRLINSSNEVEPFYNEYIDYKNKVKMVQYSISNIEDAVFLISREVTRRNSDFDGENRNYNVGGY